MNTELSLKLANRTMIIVCPHHFGIMANVLYLLNFYTEYLLYFCILHQPTFYFLICITQGSKQCCLCAVTHIRQPMA